MKQTIYFDGRHYDALWPGLHRKNELAFYLRNIRQSGEPALELGCGTGQLTLPLAQTGVKITGLDLSDPMLIRAQEKAVEQDMEVEWINADCRDFALDQRYGLIFFPANALLHLEIPEQERSL